MYCTCFYGSLPAPSPGPTLDLARDVLGDPAPVKVALLDADLLAVHKAAPLPARARWGLAARRVEADVILERGVQGHGSFVRPYPIRYWLAGWCSERVVCGGAFPLCPRQTGQARNQLRTSHMVRFEVVWSATFTADGGR